MKSMRVVCSILAVALVATVAGARPDNGVAKTLPRMFAQGGGEAEPLLLWPVPAGVVAAGEWMQLEVEVVADGVLLFEESFAAKMPESGGAGAVSLLHRYPEQRETLREVAAGGGVEVRVLAGGTLVDRFALGAAHAGRPAAGVARPALRAPGRGGDRVGSRSGRGVAGERDRGRGAVFPRPRRLRPGLPRRLQRLHPQRHVLPANHLCSLRRRLRGVPQRLPHLPLPADLDDGGAGGPLPPGLGFAPVPQRSVRDPPVSTGLLLPLHLDGEGHRELRRHDDGGDPVVLLRAGDLLVRYRHRVLVLDGHGSVLLLLIPPPGGIYGWREPHPPAVPPRPAVVPRRRPGIIPAP